MGPIAVDVGIKDINNSLDLICFAESNQMLNRLGVKLERSEMDQLDVTRIMRAPSCDTPRAAESGDHITISGDVHLARLQQACQDQLMRQRRPKDNSRTSSVGSYAEFSGSVTDSSSSVGSRNSGSSSGVNNSLVRNPMVQFDSSVSTIAESTEPLQATPLLGPTSLDLAFGGTAAAINSSPTANDDELNEEQFVGVTMAYSEVLQLQGNVSEALNVVVKLLGDLEVINTEGNGRHIALCNRRAAVLYKLAGKSTEAESCVRQYISLIKDNNCDTNDLAYAYALLATIIEESGGRSLEALAMDKVALSLTSKEE